GDGAVVTGGEIAHRLAGFEPLTEVERTVPYERFVRRSRSRSGRARRVPVVTGGGGREVEPGQHRGPALFEDLVVAVGAPERPGDDGDRVAPSRGTLHTHLLEEALLAVRAEGIGGDVADAP